MLGSIISAGINAVGSFFGAREQNSANSRISDRQMDFQREMSNTAYQRAMADMRKAGLNPILAYKQGGATTPPGASIPAVDAIGPAVRSGVSTAMQNRRLEADLEILEREAENKIDIGDNIRADTRLKNAQRHAATTSSKLNEMLTGVRHAEKLILDENLSSAKTAATQADQTRDYLESPVGEIGRRIELLRRQLIGGTGLYGGFSLNAPRRRK